MDLAALAAFAFVASITPGPNNLILAASGMRFGYVRSLPCVMGMESGMITVFIACSYGIGQMLLQIPGLRWLLSLFGTAYLLILLWNILNLKPQRVDSVQHDKPMSFLQAANFQFVNPKIWIIGVMVASIFLPEPSWQNIAQLIVVFIAMNVFSFSFWLLFGKLMQVSLTKPRFRLGIQGSLTCLTLYSVVSLWLW